MTNLNKQAAVIMALALFLLLPAGCMTPGQQLEASAVKDLQGGMSRDEVRQKLGTPRHSETGADGRTLDVFLFSKSTGDTTGRSSVVKLRSVHVLYDEQGTLQAFTRHVGEVRRVLRVDGLRQAGRLPAEDELKNIQRGVTSRADLIQMFGTPTIEGIDVRENRSMNWLFMEGRSSTPSRTRELAVLLDRRLLVKDFVLRDAQPWN